MYKNLKFWYKEKTITYYNVSIIDTKTITNYNKL
jgi:hypothetical protein